MIPEKKERVDIAILVPKYHEFNMMKLAFGEEQEGKMKHEADYLKGCGAPYYRLKLNDPKNDIHFTVAVIRLDKQGNTYAASATHYVFEELDPAVIFLVGTAAGRKGEVEQGDIVVSNSVLDVCVWRLSQQAKNDGEEKVKEGEYSSPWEYLVPEPMMKDLNRLRVILDADQDTFKSKLYNKFKKINQKLREKKILKDDGEFPHEIHEDEVASSSFLYEDIQQLEEKVWKPHDQAMSIDMESAGFATVCFHRNRDRSKETKKPWLVIRGISDFGEKESRKEAREKGYRKMASAIAGCFLKTFIEQGGLVESHPQKVRDRELKLIKKEVNSRKSKVILFAGTAGMRKGHYISNVMDKVAKKGKVKVFPDKSREGVEEDEVEKKYPPYRVEDLPFLRTKEGEKKSPIWTEENERIRRDNLKRSWESIKEEIIKEEDEERDEPTYHFIEFNCTFWQPHGLVYDHIHLVDTIRCLNPSCLIVLIDNVTSVKWNLRLKPDPEGAKIGLRDAILWRKNEMSASELLATMLWPGEEIPPLYVVAKGHDPDEVANLILNQNARTPKKKVYCAFPVRILKSSPEEELQEEINAFRKTLRRDLRDKYVVFDPYEIYEKEIEDLLTETDPKRVAEEFGRDFLIEGKRLYKTLLGNPFWPKNKKGEHDSNERFSINIWEIAQVLRDINAQIRERDRLIVNQSDMVIAFRPEDSEGARAELCWAVRRGKKAYALILNHHKWEKKIKKRLEEEKKEKEKKGNVKEGLFTDIISAKALYCSVASLGLNEVARKATGSDWEKLDREKKGQVLKEAIEKVVNEKPLKEKPPGIRDRSFIDCWKQDENSTG